MIIGTKFNGYSRDNIRVYPMDGGSQQPSSTTQTAELPEWARGYAKDTLGKASALTDISQNPYQSYGGNRIAGFSPMQQQSQQNAANMQTSGATGFGTQLAGAAGLGALNAQYNPTQFQAGQFGQQNAQQYMSPYMQSVVDVQQREAQRQGDIAGTQRNAQATGAGAFGGSRQAIMDAEAARNLATQKGDIQARGLQDAYGQAQSQFNADQARNMQAQQLGEQSRQYGAGYGMQGLQTALQGAGQLGALGQQQFAQGMDINKLQNAYGGQQQALKQQGLSQAYEDFQNQRNYPYKQLGFMSDMIRGLPLGQQSTKQMYEAEPNTTSQLAGLGTAAIGLSKFMAEGGITGDANVSNILSKLSDAQLEQAKQFAIQRKDINQVNMIVAEQQERAQTRGGISAAEPVPEESGIANAASDEMMDRMLPTEESMAHGGIVAFAEPNEDNNYSLVTDPMGSGFAETANTSKSDGDTRSFLERLLNYPRDPAWKEDLTREEQERAANFAPGGAGAEQVRRSNAEAAPQAAAVALPPDIGARRERPVAATTGAPSGGQDLMQLYENISNRVKKSDKGDPYAAQTKKIGDLLVKQKEDEKAAILVDAAKSATVYDERDKRLGARKTDITKREDQNIGIALMEAGFTAMATPGGLAKAIGAGAKVGTARFASGLEKIQTAKDMLEKATDDLEDLRLNRSDMSAKEIRLANSNISGAKIKAEELALTGLKEAGADSKEKAKMVYDATVKQQAAREASAGADRRAAAAADKLSETERMMKDLGNIGSGKASYMGKTGAEGLKLYEQNRATASGVRYAGQDKSIANALALEKLMQGDDAVKMLKLNNSNLIGKTDKASQTKLAANNAEIKRIRDEYKAAMPGSGTSGGKVSANDPLGLGFGDT